MAAKAMASPSDNRLSFRRKPKSTPAPPLDAGFRRHDESSTAVLPTPIPCVNHFAVALVFVVRGISLLLSDIRILVTDISRHSNVRPATV